MISTLPEKIEVFLVGSKTNLKKLKLCDISSVVKSVEVVQDLEVFLDSENTMD